MPYRVVAENFERRDNGIVLGQTAFARQGPVPAGAVGEQLRGLQVR
ncbi:hypothetical protein [Promicromonospora umidemergens]|nr:hypothetical protein [Promicromonospora umidemergens]